MAGEVWANEMGIPANFWPEASASTDHIDGQAPAMPQKA